MNEILKRYHYEVRTKPVATPNLKVVSNDYVTRLEEEFNFICSWTFSDDNAQLIVSEQTNYFRQIGEELIWRVYGHDTPSILEECLKEEGFIPKSK